MYADDIVLLSKSSNGLLQILNCLETFCNDWCLDVNISKTKVLISNKAGRHLKENFILNKEPLGPITLDEIYSKSFCEKLHYKFCRFLLSVNCKSTKFAVPSELGRHPMSFRIIQHTLNYWHRLENLDDDTFPLLKAAYSASVSNFNSNKTSWFGCIEFFKQLLPQLNSFLNTTVEVFLILILLKKGILEGNS